MQGGGTLARNTGPRQWAKPALIQCWLHKRLMGELAGMARNPFAGQCLDLLGRRLGIYVQAAVAFDLAHLLAHSCAEQGMFIGKGNPHAIATASLATPRHIARITGAGAQ